MVHILHPTSFQGTLPALSKCKEVAVLPQALSTINHGVWLGMYNINNDKQHQQTTGFIQMVISIKPLLLIGFVVPMRFSLRLSVCCSQVGISYANILAKQ